MFQLSKNFSLTPDVQLLIEPSNNPRDEVWVFGLRMLLTM
ncbi:MAG: carbohydrate porin [Gammaproteobacteria bacterium]